MNHNCLSCGAQDYTDYDDEYVCNYCGNSGFKTSEDRFTEKERELLVKNGFRKNSKKSYIKSTKSIDFIISRHRTHTVGDYKFTWQVYRKPRLFEHSIPTLSLSVENCLKAFSKEMQTSLK